MVSSLNVDVGLGDIAYEKLNITITTKGKLFYVKVCTNYITKKQQLFYFWTNYYRRAKAAVDGQMNRSPEHDWKLEILRGMRRHLIRAVAQQREETKSVKFFVYSEFWSGEILGYRLIACLLY